MGGRLVTALPLTPSPLLTTIPPCPDQGGSLHNQLERKHGRNHCPARPSLRLATAWCWSGSSGYRLWRTAEEEEEQEVRSWGLGGLHGLGGCYGRLQALVHHPPTHRQKPPGRPTQPTCCLCQLSKRFLRKMFSLLSAQGVPTFQWAGRRLI